MILMASVGLIFVSIAIGYPICHGVVGPVILAKRERRRFLENYRYFGNIVQMEHDLMGLAESGDRAAITVLRVIAACKWTIVANLVLIAVLLMRIIIAE